MKIFTKSLLTLVFGLPFLAATPAKAHVCDFGSMTMDQVGDGFYVIGGSAGNVGVSVGEDGVFLIDDQMAPLTEELLAMIRGVSDGPIKFVLNTHLHGDHTGGNENLGKKGAVILAHDNVRAGLIGRGVSEGTLPVITFNDKVSIHFNGHEARAVHFENAHTDGDSVIFFDAANIVHMGDTVFNSCYPFIDTNSGGSYAGTVAVVESVLEKIDQDTVVIPGHGPVTDKAGLQVYLDMLETIGGRIKALKAEGKTLEDVLATSPTAEYDEIWTWGFINGERFTTALYNMLED